MIRTLAADRLVTVDHLGEDTTEPAPDPMADEDEREQKNRRSLERL